MSASALGARLSIDDFGAGYTSLSQLTSMPFSEIKIDRWFVMTMTDNPSNAAIVRSVIELGHNLGMTLVAEGVEDEHALTALAGLGCDIAQGYHLSRPLTADAFDTWCTERSITPVSPVTPEPTMPRATGRNSPPHYLPAAKWVHSLPQRPGTHRPVSQFNKEVLATRSRTV